MTRTLLGCEKISGFCYTQLYDVEQEQNGLYTYDRRPKLGPEGMRRIAECNRGRAAIEREPGRGAGCKAFVGNIAEEDCSCSAMEK